MQVITTDRNRIARLDMLVKLLPSRTVARLITWVYARNMAFLSLSYERLHVVSLQVIRIGLICMPSPRDVICRAELTQAATCVGMAYFLCTCHWLIIHYLAVQNRFKIRGYWELMPIWVYTLAKLCWSVDIEILTDINYSERLF